MIEVRIKHCDSPDDLMSEHDWDLLGYVPVHEVTPTDPAELDLDEHIASLHLGDRVVLGDHELSRRN